MTLVPRTLDEQRAEFARNKFLAMPIAGAIAFAIAIPFFLVEPTSLPLPVGILSGLMWIPFSWMIQHPLGLFHAIGISPLP